MSDALRLHRLTLMRDFMHREGYDALVFTGPDWFEWVSNHPIRDQAWERPYVLVVPANGKVFAIMSHVGRLQMAAERRRKTLWLDSVIHYGETPYFKNKGWMSTQWDEMVADALKAAGLERAKIGADAVTSPLAQAAALLPSLKIKPAGEGLRKLRWVKHAEEVATMRDLSALSDWAMHQFRNELRPGRLLAEIDYGVCQKLMVEGARRFAGQQLVINKIITLSGASSACTHGDGALTGKTVEANAGCVTTISTKLNGLVCELTRTWLIGAPSQQIKLMYDCTLDAHDAALTAAAAGKPVSGIHAAAFAVFDRGGYADSFILRSTHGIGMVMHEYPHNAPLEDRVLLEGETFAVEPGLYVENIGGFRSADMTVIGRNGPEIMTQSPRDRATQTLN